MAQIIPQPAILASIPQNGVEAPGQLFPNSVLTQAQQQQNAPAINSIVSNIATQAGNAAEQTAASKAASITAGGQTAQATSYGKAAQIATANAGLQAISGKISQFQALRSAFRTIGSQKAAVAASGFTGGGSNLSLLRSSTQQAYLNNQVLGLNSELAQAGYLEQAAASQGEQAQATSAASASNVLSAAEAKAGQLAQSNATNEAAALSSLFPTSPAGTLGTEIAKGTPVDVSSFAGQLAATTGLAATSGLVSPANLPGPVGFNSPKTVPIQ